MTLATIARASKRTLIGVLFALLLAVRLVGPAGFMPQFDHGAVTIVTCPDADIGTHSVGDHGGHSPKLHQPCPYAASSSPGGLAADFGGLIVALLFTAAILLGRTFLFIERHSLNKRPPSTGPPIPA